MVPIALKAAEMLEAEGISAAVVNMHTVKPIDAENNPCYEREVQRYR
mgnify:CR=1 FL=1